jgi:transcriptional regulator with XRE-family HTH domain
VDPAVAFGKVLRELRLAAGLTQEELGFESDLQRVYISVLELGKKQPTLTTIMKLAKAFGRSAKEIVGMVEAEMAKPRKKG